MLRRDPLINKEHGSWAILFIPPFTAILASGTFTGITVIYLILSLFAFLIARPAEIYFQDILKKNPASAKRENAFFWMLIYSVITGVLLILLLSLTSAYKLLGFGFAALFFIIISQSLQYASGKTLIRDLSGIAGLTIGAPALHYLAAGVLSYDGALLWLYNFLFFASGAFYVHSEIERQGGKSAQNGGVKNKRNLSIAYHIVLAIALICFIIETAPAALAVAYLPMIIQSALSVTIAKGKANFKKIGFTLLAYSIFFGIVIGTM